MIIIDNIPELQEYLKQNRNKISSINGIQFSGYYPLLKLSNKHVMYYCVSKQDYLFLDSPFKITLL